MTDTQDIVIIGGGPGGYVAAIYGARQGAKVTIVEKADFGGTCLNWGCIPTKALLASAEILAQISEAKTFGINISGFSFDLATAMARKDGVVRQLVSGIEGLFRANGVRVVRGTGDIVGPGQVKVSGEQGEQLISTKNIIIATGSRPATLPIPGLDGDGIINSDQAVHLKAVPKRLLAIGGGAIGVEFGDIFHRFGSQVTIVELMDRLIPLEDAELGEALQRSFEKRGIRVLTGTGVKSVRSEGAEKVVTVTKGDKQEDIRVDTVLVAVGRGPNTQGLSLSKAGINVERGRIVADEHMRTSVRGIYAIGDVVGKMMLAHVASHEGMVAVDNILGKDTTMDYRAIPRCIYTKPEVAGVGMTEAMARERGGEITVGRFPFSANGKALCVGEPEGFVKVIADKKYGEVLGIGIIGPHATELIAEGTLSIGMEGTVEDIAHIVHAHPTLSEAKMEAALDALGLVIHFPPRRTKAAGQ